MRKRGRFDYILLETTGLADPGMCNECIEIRTQYRRYDATGPIASIFWQNEDLSKDILLDGVVCVMDGVFGLDVSDLAEQRVHVLSKGFPLTSKSKRTKLLET